jgi:hypothetical protein
MTESEIAETLELHIKNNIKVGKLKNGTIAYHKLPHSFTSQASISFTVVRRNFSVEELCPCKAYCKNLIFKPAGIYSLTHVDQRPSAWVTV